MTTTVDTTTITVELSEAFDPRWNRLPGITVDGMSITIDPAEYFFRFENSSWLVIDWQTVKDGLLAADETESSAVEQMALDFETARRALHQTDQSPQHADQKATSERPT